jgi:hypothetical protein
VEDIGLKANLDDVYVDKVRFYRCTFHTEPGMFQFTKREKEELASLFLKRVNIPYSDEKFVFGGNTKYVLLRLNRASNHFSSAFS